MYHPCSGPAFLPPGVKGGMFSLCPKNSSLYTTHEGFGNGNQVRRIVTQSLRVPCEWMQPSSGDVGGRCSGLGGDLLDAVLRFVQVQRGADPGDYASCCTSLLVGCTSWFADFPLRYLRSWLRSGESASGTS